MDKLEGQIKGTRTKRHRQFWGKLLVLNLIQSVSSFEVGKAIVY